MYRALIWSLYALYGGIDIIVVLYDISILVYGSSGTAYLDKSTYGIVVV